jgi:hypothetical protein
MLGPHSRALQDLLTKRFQISLAEMHKLVATLLRSYRIELTEPGKKWQTHNFWFNKQTGIMVKVTAR